MPPEHFLDGLISVTIPKTVTKIGQQAFICKGLKQVFISDLAAWCKINFDAYSNPLCSAHHLFLGDTEVKDLRIPYSVTEIAENAFSDCDGLRSVTFHDHVTKIGACSFFNCTNITKLVIPNCVKEIGAAAFERCVGLTWVVIPNSVNLIGDYAFEFCSNLKNVTIPKRFDTGFMHSNLKKLFGDSYKNIQFKFI